MSINIFTYTTAYLGHATDAVLGHAWFADWNVRSGLLLSSPVSWTVRLSAWPLRCSRRWMSANPWLIDTKSCAFNRICWSVGLIVLKTFWPRIQVQFCFLTAFKYKSGHATTFLMYRTLRRCAVVNLKYLQASYWKLRLSTLLCHCSLSFYIVCRYVYSRIH